MDAREERKQGAHDSYKSTQGVPTGGATNTGPSLAEERGFHCEPLNLSKPSNQQQEKLNFSAHIPQTMGYCDSPDAREVGVHLSHQVAAGQVVDRERSFGAERAINRHSRAESRSPIVTNFRFTGEDQRHDSALRNFDGIDEPLDMSSPDSRIEMTSSSVVNDLSSPQGGVYGRKRFSRDAPPEGCGIDVSVHGTSSLNRGSIEAKMVTEDRNLTQESHMTPQFFYSQPDTGTTTPEANAQHRQRCHGDVVSTNQQTSPQHGGSPSSYPQQPQTTVATHVSQSQMPILIRRKLNRSMSMTHESSSFNLENSSSRSNFSNKNCDAGMAASYNSYRNGPDDLRMRLISRQDSGAASYESDRQRLYQGETQSTSPRDHNQIPSQQFMRESSTRHDDQPNSQSPPGLCAMSPAESSTYSPQHVAMETYPSDTRLRDNAERGTTQRGSWDMSPPQTAVPRSVSSCTDNTQGYDNIVGTYATSAVSNQSDQASAMPFGLAGAVIKTELTSDDDMMGFQNQDLHHSNGKNLLI